jgi:hypothetical protein
MYANQALDNIIIGKLNTDRSNYTNGRVSYATKQLAILSIFSLINDTWYIHNITA